jgi:hypothetical protein
MDGYLKFLKTLEEPSKMSFICPFICYFRGNYGLRLRENKNINGIKEKIDDKAHIICFNRILCPFNTSNFVFAIF